MNTDLRKKTKNNLMKLCLFKLINNADFRKNSGECEKT